jgi:hypothetical protein
VILAFGVSTAGSVREPRTMPSRQYRLVVEGELSDHVGLGLEGMALSREGGNTVLVGRVRDQAELQGYLQRLADFGLTLLSAEAVDEERLSANGPLSRSQSPG